jgi:hypothetical protein
MYVREGEIEINTFLTSESNGDEWSSYSLTALPFGKNSSTH